MTVSSSPALAKPVDRSDPAALLNSLDDELQGIDLSKPLPASVVGGLAIARSNGDGIEADPLVIKLAVLASRGVITSEESVSLAIHLCRGTDR